MLASGLRSPHGWARKILQWRRRRRLERVAVIGVRLRVGAGTCISNSGPRRNVQIGRWVTLNNYELRSYGGSIQIGDCVSMSSRGQIAAVQVEIGDFSIFGRDVYIADANEHPTDLSIRRAQTEVLQEMGVPPDRTRASHASVRIGRDVWAGGRAIILKGVAIADGAIVAAGAVVTSDVPPVTIAAGNPGRVVKQLEQNVEFVRAGKA